MSRLIPFDRPAPAAGVGRAAWLPLAKAPYPPPSSLEPAHPVAKTADLLAHPRQINGGIAHTLVEEDDLAERPYRVAIEAHAAAVSFRRRSTGSRVVGPARLSATLR